MKCKVSMRFNKEVDFKKVSIHVGNFAVTADGQKFFLISKRRISSTFMMLFMKMIPYSYCMKEKNWI